MTFLIAEMAVYLLEQPESNSLIAAYFFEDFPSVNIETCIIAGLVGAWRGTIKELNKREQMSVEKEN